MKRPCQLIPVLIFAFAFLVSANAHAVSKKRGGKGAFAGGSISLGLGLALATAEQTGMNGLIASAKAAVGSSASSMTSATEYVGYATFKFANGFTAIQLRPSFFSQSSSGSGSDGSHDYSLSGFTIFPLARIIPLSNDLIDFYIQGGLGYGKLDGSAKNGSREAKFSGSAFGVQAGLGAEFCFVPDHCFNIEGNYRYLPIVRNIISSGSGLAPHGAGPVLPDRELEDLNGNDISTTLSGVSGMISYTYNF